MCHIVDTLLALYLPSTCTAIHIIAHAITPYYTTLTVVVLCCCAQSRTHTHTQRTHTLNALKAETERVNVVLLTDLWCSCWNVVCNRILNHLQQLGTALPFAWHAQVPQQLPVLTYMYVCMYIMCVHSHIRPFQRNARVGMCVVVSVYVCGCVRGGVCKRVQERRESV